MYKFLLFDADDTIFDFLKAERVALQQAMEDCNIEFKEEYVSIYSAHNISMWQALERKEITKPELIATRFSTFFQKMGFKEDPEAMREAYQRRLSEQSFLLEGAYELLEKLHENYKIYLITNGLKQTQTQRFSKSGILPFLTNVFISEEVGFEKPDKRYFEAVKSHISDFREEEALVIGDSLTSDIMGGNNAGIETVWFNPKQKANDSKARPDYEIRSLEQLYDLLAR